MAVHIERINASRRGFRAAELLGLTDTDLVAAVAPQEAAAIRDQTERAPDAVRERLVAARCWATCQHDGSYPEGLRDLEDSAPHALLGRGDVGLLTRISDPSSVVALVGARKATSYGLDIGRELSASLALTEIAVVSGMALGIDSEAHRGALDAGGITIAALAGGPDVAYPASHAALHRQICERGIVISELPPGVAPLRWMFPARNRVIAALAGMTVTVQAGERSGSLITARIASDLGRDVGAVPGEIRLPVSAGANALVADGAALVNGPQAVLDRLAGLNPQISRVLTGPALVDESLRLALDAIEQGCVTGDAIAEIAGLSGEEAAVALAQLELLGYASLGSAGGYIRTSLQQPEGA